MVALSGVEGKSFTNGVHSAWSGLFVDVMTHADDNELELVL